MSSLISQNLVVIVIAILVGLIVGWWVLRRPAKGKLGDQPPAAAPKLGEGKSLADEDAAAVADIVGEFLGVDVHAELPGATGPADNLQTMKGVGAKLAARLNENGIIRFDQLAALSPAQVEALDARMDPFKGRIARDRLVEQADLLAKGDIAGFEAKFGNLGSGQL